MIVDSSAIVAIFLQEPGYKALLRKMSAAQACGIGAPTAAECGLVLTVKLNTNVRELLEAFFKESGVSILPFTESHWPVALDAYLRFGKGRHKAALNYGDCLCYAIAQVASQPLLFAGNDFSKTDVLVA